MSHTNRATGRSSKSKTDSVPSKSTVVKNDSTKMPDKEKKIPTAEQIRLANLAEKSDTNNNMQEKFDRLKAISLKSEDEIATALHDCDNDVELAVSYLLEGKTEEGWLTQERKKKRRAASVPKNGADVKTGEKADNSNDWKDSSNGYHGERTRGYRGISRARGSTRTTDRGSFNRDRRSRPLRENKENGGEDGYMSRDSGGRDYRLRNDRNMNGLSRMGRGGGRNRRIMGGGGPGSSRTFQSRDNDRNSAGAGFPNQIDTWMPQESNNHASLKTTDEFPAAEDWDNDEYTESLAEGKVFTASSNLEADIKTKEVTALSTINESDVKVEGVILTTPNHTTSTSSANPSTIVTHNTQLNEAQSKFFERLATQTDNQSPIQQTISPSKSQSTTFAGVSQQTYSTVSLACSRNNVATEYTPTTYNDDVNNYSLNNSALPQRSSKSQIRQESSKVSTNVENPHADVLKSSDINYLEGKFSTMNFNNSNESYDISTNATLEKTDVNKYSVPTSASSVTGNSTVPPPVEITSIAFQSPQQPKVIAATETTTIQNENNVYSSQTITNSRIATATGMPDLTNSTPTESVMGSYGTLSDYQTQSAASAYQKVSTPTASVHSAASQSPFHQNAVNTTVVSSASNVYTNQQPQPSQSTPTNNQQTVVQSQNIASTGNGVSSTYQTNSTATNVTSCSTFSIYNTNHSVAAATNPSVNSMYNNFNSLPAVSATYMSFPIPQYQTTHAGISQTQYYGGSSLASLGAATYGGSPYHNNYLSQQTPLVTNNPSQNQKVTGSSLATSVASKESQYDGLSNMTSVAGNAPSTTNAVSINSLSTTTSTKVTSSSAANGKTMLPNIPPGVQPLLGHAPQYIVSQPPMSLYPPFINYDEVYNMSRGMTPHLQTGYLDLNYAPTPQTNIAPGGREAVPYSSMSDARFTRPDNTTSPVPPSVGGAASAAMSQQNTPHQQQAPAVPLVQTYATYIYPPYQQYPTPVYQVAQTATPAGAPCASTNATLTGAQFAKATAAGYNSTGYASQFESLNNNTSSVADYSATKGNPNGSYSSQPAQTKTGSSSASVQTQNPSANASDLYNKTHAHAASSLTKTYDNKTFHSNTPPPYQMTGSGTASNNLGTNASSAATNYPTQLFIPNVAPTHHMHQNAHHQEAVDMRSTANSDRNYYIANNRSVYR